MPKKITTEEFIQRAKSIHGDKYDYDESVYVGAKIKIKVICKRHGMFVQRPDAHLNGSLCPICGELNRRQNKRYDNNMFIEKAEEKHGNLYDYSGVDYQHSQSLVKIICRVHGVFKQIPNNHLNGKGCPKCKTSKGEIAIENCLIKNNIKHKMQYAFNDCKYKQPLPFDFYLPEYNMCIEYDGQQHYESVIHWGGDDKLKYTKENDGIKNDFCVENNIKLIRIPYWDFDNIEVILDDVLTKS